MSVEKSKVVVVGVGGGENSVNGGRNVIVEEGDGVGAIGIEGDARLGTGCISPSSSPIQHRTSAT